MIILCAMSLTLSIIFFHDQRSRKARFIKSIGPRDEAGILKGTSEKNTGFTLEAPIETHVLAASALANGRRQGQFFVVHLSWHGMT